MQYFLVYQVDNLGNLTFVASENVTGNANSSFSGLETWNYEIYAYSESVSCPPNPSPIGTPDMDLTQIGSIQDGCFDLSNPITVIRNGVNGGDLMTTDSLTEITICAGDGVSDAFDVDLSGNEGANSVIAIPPDQCGCTVKSSPGAFNLFSN